LSVASGCFENYRCRAVSLLVKNISTLVVLVIVMTTPEVELFLLLKGLQMEIISA
jgi:hypothetical protein